MNPLGYVKEHPYLSGSLIVGVIVLFLLLRGGSSSSSSPGNADLNSIYAAQSAADTADKQINAQLSAQNASIAGNIELAKIGSQRDLSLATLQQQLGLAQISAQQQSTDLANTLTANVAIKNIQGQVDINALNNATQQNMYNNLANILITQAQENASVARASIENQCHGFGCLF